LLNKGRSPGGDIENLAEAISFDNFKQMYYNKTGTLPENEEEEKQLRSDY